tara:strand:- start:311 stop:643 length:333 start_codon:yes stop_codon:yes gene_type:complete
LIKFLSKKKVKKPLDISPEISDNINKEELIDIAPSNVTVHIDVEDTKVKEEVEEIDENIGVVLDDAEIDEKIEEELTPEEVKEVKKKIEREINTQAIKRDGWLDDIKDKK